jgi:hypothetical protein
VSWIAQDKYFNQFSPWIFLSWIAQSKYFHQFSPRIFASWMVKCKLFTRYSPQNIVPWVVLTNRFIDNLLSYHRTKFDIRSNQLIFFSHLPNIKFYHCVHRSEYKLQTCSDHFEYTIQMSNTRSNCTYFINQQNVKGKLFPLHRMNDSWGREKISPFFLKLWTYTERSGKFYDPGDFTCSEKKRRYNH